MNLRTGTKVAFLASAMGLALAATASADIVSDQAAALVVYPRVVFAETGPTTGNTLIQLTNTSNQPQNAHCFYVDGGSHCSVSERLCDAVEEPCAPEEGFCTPRWVETDFDVVLTPRQPLAWVVSEGLSRDELPLDGDIVGPGNSTNVGTLVPPVVFPFLGELKCIVVDGVGNAIPNNVLIGNATLVKPDDVDKSNAIGILAIDGDANKDNVLVLGGGDNEYNGCPQVLIVDHFFDFAVVPDSGPAFSRLTLIPCTENLELQIPGATTAQYLVFNEFEQRFSTSAPVSCFFDRQLSRIDTTNPERSIFSAFVSGTIAGQTRVRGVQQGLLGLLTTETPGGQAATNLHFQGDRPDPDRWTLP